MVKSAIKLFMSEVVTLVLSCIFSCQILYCVIQKYMCESICCARKMLGRKKYFYDLVFLHVRFVQSLPFHCLGQ